MLKNLFLVNLPTSLAYRCLLYFSARRLQYFPFVYFAFVPLHKLLSLLNNMPPLNFSVGAHPLRSQYSHNAGQTSPETSPRATLETDISSLGESVAASKKATDSQMQLLHKASSFSPRQSLPNPDVGAQPQNQSIPPLSDILSMYGPKSVVKTMDKVLPPDVDISQEVLDAMEACAVWFIRSTTAEAVRILNSSPTQ
ncbi:hypothetical protein BDR22DRAFT_384339 [Usnea florida]